ncbi:MAG: aminotransferase class I/II-fold pyridoxal phosphate-dependent enzyme [Pseudomonadota bacterium]
MTDMPPGDHRSVVRRQGMPASATWPAVNSIQPSVVYAARDADALDGTYLGGEAGFTYSREGHPNWQALAAKLDWMEGAEGGLVTGSGMAAVFAAFQSVLKVGDHVVAGDQLYGRSLRMLKEEVPRWGVEVTFCDPTDAKSVEAAMRPETRLMLVEVVSNPTIRVADMAKIPGICARHGVALAVDNTFTTPRLYRPFEHGADFVIHSVTKMLSGHSDAMLGYVAAKDRDAATRLRDVALTMGLTPSPFDCWLAERGLHTFDLRFAQAQSNAQALADRIAGLPGVEAVLYPTRHDHPDHNRAKDLLPDGGGTMFSFRLTGGRAAVNRFIHAAPHIPFAPTLGDVATMVSHPPTSSHRGLTEAERAAIGITEGFLRVSTGIEDTGLLLAEFEAAISASQG